MTDDDLHQLAGAYALDALDPSERAAFEAHLSGCSSCSTAVSEYSLTAGEIGELGRLVPPEGLRERVLAGIAVTPQVPAGPIDELAARRRLSTRVLASAAAVVFVAVGAVAALELRNTSDDDLLAAPDAIAIQLDPVDGASPGGVIEVVWSAEQDRAIVRTAGLADPGEGMVYELWFLVDDGVAPAGLFTPENGAAETRLDLDDIDGQGWGVTIEPEGGSEQPTSAVLFTGTA